MQYPYRLGEEKLERGVSVNEVMSADGRLVFGTICRQLPKGPVTAVSVSGDTLGHYKTKSDAAKTVAQWGLDNVEGRQHG